MPGVPRTGTPPADLNQNRGPLQVLRRRISFGSIQQLVGWSLGIRLGLYPLRPDL